MYIQEIVLSINDNDLDGAEDHREVQDPFEILITVRAIAISVNIAVISVPATH